MWKALNHPFLTLVFDSFKSGCGVYVLNMTESAVDKCAFKLCVDAGTNLEFAAFYGEQITSVLSKISRLMGKSVEDIYAGVFGDNVTCNRTAFSIRRTKYPKLFFIGCIAHYFDLFMKYSCSIAEIDDMINYARSITTFVNTHKYIQVEFKKVIRECGLVLKLFPSTRFSYADLLLIRCLNKNHNLENIIHCENWSNFKQGITETAVSKSDKDVHEMPERKMNSLHEFLLGITKVTHFIESVKARSSWVYPLISAVSQLADECDEKLRTINCFSRETIHSIQNMILDRWNGLDSGLGSSIACTY